VTVSILGIRGTICRRERRAALGSEQLHDRDHHGGEQADDQHGHHVSPAGRHACGG
jgi:hypothetical protein